ncbi:MAG: cupin domain-containing protein, partial [Lysobacterales bacterium]
LEPGDMLYLPPDIAHHGVALEPGMTFSIGARAPSAADLLQGLGEWFAIKGHEGGRYSDPALEPVTRPGEIERSALHNLRALMLAGLDANPDLDNFLAAFVSRFRMAHEPLPPPTTIRAGKLLRALQQGVCLLRNPWTRLAWIEYRDGARMYAAGQSYDCSIQLAETLCESEQPCLSKDMLDPVSLQTLARLVNNGHFLMVNN